jgi:hypothetical protein
MSARTDDWTPPTHWPRWPTGRDLVYLTLIVAAQLSSGFCKVLVDRSFGGIVCYEVRTFDDYLSYGLPLLVLFLELVLRWRKEGWASRLCFSILSSLMILVAIYYTNLSPYDFPEPAGIYLRWWRPYVESHWQVDPVTHLIYFPLDYAGSSNKDDHLVAPLNFLVLDDKKAFVIDPYSTPGRMGRLRSPTCPDADLEVLRLEGQIYIVRQYADDFHKDSESCLITPTKVKDENSVYLIYKHPEWFRGNPIPTWLQAK